MLVTDLLARSDDSAGIADAIISTVGVLLGVVLGGVLTITLESRRERRKLDRLERAARRLVADELTRGSKALRNIAEERVVRAEGIPEGIPSWATYRELFATRMADEEWRVVSAAVESLYEQRDHLRPIAATDVGIGELPPRMEHELTLKAENLESAAMLVTGQNSRSE